MTWKPGKVALTDPYKAWPLHGTRTLLLANDGAVSLLCQSASDPRGCALYTSICATHFIMLTSSCVCPLPLHDHSLICMRHNTNNIYVARVN